MRTHTTDAFLPVFCLYLLMTMMLMLGGCTARGNGKSTGKETLPDGTYLVYYKNASGDELLGRQYTPTGETFDEIVGELIVQLAISPGTDTVTTLPETITIQALTRGVDSLTVDLSSGYLALGATDQVLLEAALVRTLIQLPGVLGIRITVDGQELINEAGDPIGTMNEESFVWTADQTTFLVDALEASTEG